MKIGIITANYNNYTYFDDYFKGLTRQSMKPHMVAYVDDCSTDGSLERIRGYLSVYQKRAQTRGIATMYNINGIEFYTATTNKNSGPAHTRNVAISILRKNCDVLCVCDSDDYYTTEKIAKSVAVLKKYPHVGLVYSDYTVINQAAGTQTREYKEIFRRSRLLEECIVSNNSIFPTKILDKIGIYDESLFGPEDYDLWLRISDVAAVHHIPESLYYYRITGNNLTVTTNKSRLAEHVRRVHQKAMERTRGQSTNK